MKIRRLPQADRDLDEIWDRIARDDPGAADRLIGQISTATDRLARFPNSGQARPEIGPTARSLVSGKYLILYRLGINSVDIVRIVHGARDLSGLLKDS